MPGTLSLRRAAGQQPFARIAHTVLSLAHRAPALLPHAAAGNGVPDSVLATLPAYEPRLGGLVQGVPHAAAPQASASQAVAAPVSASTPGAVIIFWSHRQLQLHLRTAVVHRCRRWPTRPAVLRPIAI
ncbi:hypothetical protein [Comamonas sp. JC664]|uniref:hypothetical protein n=1 Tax=Comamonas sp. JC664 TaxID=2801917 RepID=UPI0036095CA6